MRTYSEGSGSPSTSQISSLMPRDVARIIMRLPGWRARQRRTSLRCSGKWNMARRMARTMLGSVLALFPARIRPREISSPSSMMMSTLRFDATICERMLFPVPAGP